MQKVRFPEVPGVKSCLQRIVEMTEVSPFEPRGRDHDDLMENSEVGVKFEKIGRAHV